nr:hypothetical protein [Tanacetum cinerariifolium]
AVAPTTTEQRLVKNNELMARGTLLMALPDKHQLKFNIHKDAKSLMEAIKRRFGGNKETKKVQKTLLKQQYENFSGQSSKSLDQIHDRLQKLIRKLDQIHDRKLQKLISQLEILGESLSQEDINLKFLRSLPSDVSSASTKPPTSILPNVDNLSDAVIYSFFASQSNSPQLDNDNLKQIDADDLEEMDLKWSPRDTKNKETQRRTVPVETSTSNALVSECDGVSSYDWSFQDDEEPTNYALMAFTSSSSSSSDNKVAHCTKACFKAYATLKSHYDKLTVDFRMSQFDILSYKTGLESIEARLVVYQHNENVFEEDIKFFETDESVPTSPVHDRYKLGDGYHVVPPLYKGTFMPPTPNLVFHDAPTTSETVLDVFNVEPSTTQPTKELSQSNRPFAPIIEDWVSDSKDESEVEPMTTQIEPSFVQTSEHVKTLRTSIKPVEHPTQDEKLRKDIPKPRGHKHSWTRKAYFVCKSLNHLIKDGDYYKKRMVQKPVRNYEMRVNHQNSTKIPHPHTNSHVVPISILTKSRLVPLNAARPVTTVVYQATMTRPRPGNPQQDLNDKGVIDSGCSRHMTGNISYLSDFKEINGGYVAFSRNPKGGKIAGKGDLTSLFAKATLDESNFWHRQIGHINFKTMNKLVKDVAGNQPNQNTCIEENFDAGTVGDEAESVQQYVLLPLWSTGSKDPQNTDTNDAFDVKEPESKVYVSLSSSDKTKKHDEKTKREAKGKSHVDLSTGVRNLSDELKYFSSNSTNGVIAASAPVTAIEPTLPNSTNSLNAASPSNNVVSPTFKFGRKSSFVDPSQYTNDLDMPALEDIIYSDDEEDVGVEADFSNLETSITVSPILTTRVHKDHPVTQIIEPKRVHQALNDPSWIKAMQKELLQFKMQKVWVLVDLPKGKRAIGSKWVFRNKKDERGIVIRKKDRLVANGNTQEEGIDYEEVFAPVARIEAINLFLDYDSFMGFMVYQMDVKSAFPYGTIKEEFCVCQPPDLKTLIILIRGKIDQTFFIKKQKGNILLVSVYVDDIIFGSTNKKLCKALEKLMKDKFQMSSMDGKSASTFIDTKKPLLKDPDGEDVDVHIYRSMISSLMYHTSSRPDIMFAVCECAHFQVTPRALDLHAVKMIFRQIINDFWAFVSIKKSNDAVKLQALIDKKKVIIIEDTIRQNLRLDDADGIDCLPNEEIFTELARMGYEKSRIGKGFSGVETPLFDAMLVPQQVQAAVAEVEEDEDEDNEVPAAPTPPLQKIAQALEIVKLKQRVRKLKKKGRTKHSCLKRLRKVGTTPRVKSSNETVVDDQEDASKQGRGIVELDANKDVTLKDVDAEVEINANIYGRMADSQAKAYNLDLQHLKKVLSMQDTNEAEPNEVEEVLKCSMERRGVVIQDPKETTTSSVIIHLELEAEINANINWKDVLEKVKSREKQDNTVMRYHALKRKPVTEAQERKNMMIYLKNMTGFKMDIFKVAKKQRIDEEEEELKTHLQIVANDDDNVFTEATPLETKLVKKRFKSTKPKNFLDDFLLNTFKIMFEKPNIEANVWRDQKGIYGIAKTSRMYVKRLLLLVEELVLLVHIDAVRENDYAAEEIKKLL